MSLLTNVTASFNTTASPLCNYTTMEDVTAKGWHQGSGEILTAKLKQLQSDLDWLTNSVGWDKRACDRAPRRDRCRWKQRRRDPYGEFKPYKEITVPRGLLDKLRTYNPSCFTGSLYRRYCSKIVFNCLSNQEGIMAINNCLTAVTKQNIPKQINSTKEDLSTWEKIDPSCLPRRPWKTWEITTLVIGILASVALGCIAWNTKILCIMWGKMGWVARPNNLDRNSSKESRPLNR